MDRFICERCFNEVVTTEAPECCGSKMVASDIHFSNIQRTREVPVERWSVYGKWGNGPDKSVATPAGSIGQAVREYNGPALFPRSRRY